MTILKHVSNGLWLGFPDSANFPFGGRPFLESSDPPTTEGNENTRNLQGHTGSDHKKHRCSAPSCVWHTLDLKPEGAP